MLDTEILDRLRLMYVQSLGRGSFPHKECYFAGFGNGALRFSLDLYLADMAGIASHGQKLRDISPERRQEFLGLSSHSFWDRFPSPETQQRITLEDTPTLFRLMKDTEQARQMIVAYLAAKSDVE